MSSSKTGNRTKVVVRRLPPALTEEGFRQTLGKLLEELKHDWFAFYPGKASQKRVVFSRAYINFTTPEAVYEFKQAFDGHLFVGTKGNQYRCSVEYAPYQKIPLLSAKKDNRDGTIFKDPDYQEFLKLLEQGPDALPSASAQLEAQERAAAGSTADGAAIITPLMEFLMDKYASHPNMKLGGLKKKKKDEAAAAAAEASKALLKRKQKHEDVEPHAKDKHGGPGAAAPSPASKAGGKHARPKQEAPAVAPVVVLMKPKPQEHGNAREANSREGGGHARPGTGDRGAGAKHGVAHHDKPAAKPDSRPARQQQQQQQQHKETTPHPSSAQPRTAAVQPSRSVAPEAAAAAAAAAALQRIPASTAAAAAGAGAAGDGDDQRARKVRAGFQAYTPGALRTGGGRPGQQGNKHDSG